MPKRTIAIIGGGIGGMAAGAALLHAGFRIRIFERAKRLREAGAGVILWPNATGILQELGALAGVLGQGQSGTHFQVRTSSGEVLMEIATGAADMPTVGVHRADLLHTLAGLVPRECVCLDHELAEARFRGSQLALRFTNGEGFVCDGLVGADGVHSRIRTDLLRASRPRYRGYAIFRGLVEAPAALARGANGESWGPGKRFGILDVGKNKVCWYATTNIADPRVPAEDRRENLQHLFRGWHHPIPELIAASAPGEILLNSACDLAMSRTWSEEPVTLLGDAAHAVTPNLGQGACMALEDAFVLAQCMAAGAGVAKSFRRYESLRFHHCRNAILRSRWLGAIGQWEGRIAVDIRNTITRLLPARMFECHSSLEERLARLCGGKQFAAGNWHTQTGWKSAS